MDKHIVLYSADLHGNEVQYQKLVDFAIKNSVDSVIIGGDIAPKGDSNNYLEKQKEFIQIILPQLLAPLKEHLPKLKIFIIMGNDDCAANLKQLEENDPELYTLIHNKRLSLAKGFEIVGYSYVPITPFGIKDWEKFDLTTPPAGVVEEYQKRKESYRFEGYKTDEYGWHAFKFTPEMKIDSIQIDLREELFTDNAQKTIYVIHSPPNDTNLDQIEGGKHVGSFAVRQFIEEEQPYATLHGHVHETVHVSGSFKDKIGKTYCFSPGNDNVGSDLVVLVFNLYDLDSIRRVIL